MDATILLFLIQDGITNGAIYALVGVGLVLVFAVTRVILVPIGELVAFAALTQAALEAGDVPPTGALLLVLGIATVFSVLIRQRRDINGREVAVLVATNIALPLALFLFVRWVAPAKLSAWQAVFVTLALIIPLGPMLYRLAFEPMAEASVLVLLIAAFGLHLALMGLGLFFFGPEGVRTAPLIDGAFSLGSLLVTGPSIAVLVATLLMVALLAALFEATLVGKALRACSSNRLGARLVGIPTSVAGQAAFALAAFIAAVCGLLIAPITTIYFDSGFLIGLKAFVAAIMAGLLSYPLTMLAALSVGLAEAMSSFWASSYKEVLVFTIIIPVLIWRSIYSLHIADDDE
jgi:branched-chain amino acid transport system permease protein